MGHGVPWGNCKVLYQDLPFNQGREHEVLMTQFEQGYLDPKGCRKSSAHQRTWPENSSPFKGKAKRMQGAVGFGQTHLSMVTMSLGMSHWLCPQIEGKDRGHAMSSDLTDGVGGALSL